MLKELLLRKGWAGKTISRQETVERLNPIVESFIRLNYSYDAGARAANDTQLRSGIEEHQKTARPDVGKLAETIFSCGGTSYNGTELEPAAFHVGDDDAAITDQLLSLEQDFGKIVEAEEGIEHQMLTRAILSVIKANSERRLDFLREVRRRLRVV